MGNCQASEAATVVIQHPEGKTERLYWPTPAAEVMKSNPGHHVALVTLCVAEAKSGGGGESRSSVRFTHVRLLKPKDMLLVGKVYKLITSQEVSKALRQRRHLEKHRQLQQSTSRGGGEAAQTDRTAEAQAGKQERPRAAKSSAAATRQWRPSLQSISEGMS
ncbi:uncharacterized protein M6B38_349535 [Iris pallida]|uniref:Uncharacterized protein n=1 Tax=Iris pallida TaxID=29817 RepID=A0AAX6GSW8_IRIPA|nr:uncharacterized protein M6B38_349535 [Iris pallida]